MNEEELKALLGRDRYNRMKEMAEAETKALFAAINELTKAFDVIHFDIGYAGDDFIKMQKHLVIRLKSKQ